ncbi:MAG: Helicase associated domain protein [Clostridia bacterium]|nr:Helicase associated domain protein [Clostridia bacterium]
MLERHRRAAVIHPTGTGKSFLAFQLVEDHPDDRFLWLSPNDYIFENQKRNAQRKFSNVEFMTYTKLLRLSEEALMALRPETIIPDEFHRCGAYCWGRGVERLLKAYPKAKVLGLSATPIRYLDNCRNMAEELFTVDGRLCVASEMTLSEAIVRGILPAPRYVTTMLRYQHELRRYQKHIDTMVPQGMKEPGQRCLDALRRALCRADGLESIFARWLKKGGKYILFCADWAHVQEIRSSIPRWFREVDSAPHCYCLYAGKPETEAEYAAFLADQSEHIKLLLCINRLNEGIHVPDVSGVILFRPTSSPILYKQQIGRALTAGTMETPLILDVVNNFDGLTSIGTIRAEMADAARRLRQTGQDSLIRVEAFQIEEQVEDGAHLVQELEKALSNTWDMWYAEARSYYIRHGNLKVPRRYVTDSGMQLGVWIQSQRAIYSGTGKGELSPERVEALDAIGMVWGNLPDTAWNDAFELAREYAQANGDLLVPDSLMIGGFDLGKWIAYQRSRRKNGKLPADRAVKLEEIGMVWDVFDARWEMHYRQAKAYFETHGSLDIPRTYRTGDGFLLGLWVAAQRRNRTSEGKGKTLSQTQIDKLSAIGMIWDGTFDAQWSSAYARAEEYYRQNGNLDIPYVYCTPDGYKLGKWLARQKSAKKTPGKNSNCIMTTERFAKLEDIGVVWDAEERNKTTGCGGSRHI